MAARQSPKTGNCGFSKRASFKALLTAAVVVAIPLVAMAPDANAAIVWSDSDPVYTRLVPMAPLRKHKSSRRRDARMAMPAREPSKPLGPLIIAISIDRQTLKVYDANGFFAETPISTGMRGHATPMGVFSVIQKHKWHRSNIYSGAPMPYMQRITWSGVAMHAGVLPGYPASHGCIRMPTSFALKMWGWTRMGARVVITPGEIAPASFSHPLLIARKPDPAPAVSTESPKDLSRMVMPDRPAVADPAPRMASSALELRASLTTRADPVAKADAMSPAQVREPTQSADVTSAPPRFQTSEPMPGESTPLVVVDSAAPAATTLETGRLQTTQIGLPAPASAMTHNVRMDVAAAGAPPAAKLDQMRLANADSQAVQSESLAVPARRTGQVSVFVSRKDAKLYVRQNFEPVFDAPVTIAPGERPLGTHVFTAQADKDDSRVFRWTAVSLPVGARHPERHDDEDGAARRRKSVGAVDVKTPPLANGPAEALDRLTIPGDAMARIIDALSSGGSIIVSDQGIATGETGEGTDFIIPLR